MLVVTFFAVSLSHSEIFKPHTNFEIYGTARTEAVVPTWRIVDETPGFSVSALGGCGHTNRPGN
jgi:hypothetical protein